MSLGKLLFHDYYKIKPISYSIFNISALLLKTLNNPIFSNLKIIAENEVFLVNYSILLSRGSESKTLLNSIDGNEILITKFSKDVVQSAIEFLYSDNFSYECSLQELLNFSKYYHMQTLFSLCSIALTGNKVRNSLFNINSDILAIYSACVKNDSGNLVHNCSSIEPEFYKDLEPDFLIVSETSHSCHKFFLYLKSGFIRNLVNYNPNVDSIELEQFSSGAIKAMIKHCYGILEIDNSILTEVLYLAKYMDMQGLFLYCEDRISRILTPANFLDLYEMALKLQATQLIDFMNQYGEIIGFKSLNNHNLDPSVHEYLRKIREKRKANKNSEFVKIEGESQEDEFDRLLEFYPLPSDDDTVPLGVLTTPAIDLELQILDEYLYKNKNLSVKVAKDFERVDENEEEVENTTVKYNRFQELDSD